MMEIKSELKKGIKSAKRFGYFFLIMSFAVLFISWFIFEPYKIDFFELFAITYCFSSFLGIMAGMDMVRVHVKEYIKE